MKRILVYVSLVGLFYGVASGGNFSGGTGTIADPYLISTAADMAAINLNPFNCEKSFRLMADIDMTGYAFGPIGTMERPFKANFDGNNFTISSITINTNGVDSVGIFGCVDCNAQIRNLKVSNININASLGTYIGILAGYNKGALIKCEVSDSSVTGENGVGGISGLNLGQIRYCDVSNTTISGRHGVGGIAGYNRSGYIYSCTVIATITGGDFVGGIAGSQDQSSTINLCGCNVNLSGDAYIGGIAGFSGYSCIQNSTCSGRLSGSLYTGGIVGYNLNCNLSGSTSNAVVAGGTYAGGIAGYNKSGSITTTTSYCFVTGTQNVDQFFGGNVGGVFVIAQDVYSVADLNRDGIVNEADLLFFMTQWLADQAGLTSDIDHNGVVNMIDFGLLANYQ